MKTDASPIRAVAESLKKFWFETNLQKTQVLKAYSVAKFESSGVESFVLQKKLSAPAFHTILVLLDIDFPGGHIAGVTPVPIPNTEVKPR